MAQPAGYAVNRLAQRYRGKGERLEQWDKAFGILPSGNWFSG